MLGGGMLWVNSSQKQKCVSDPSLLGVFIVDCVATQLHCLVWQLIRFSYHLTSTDALWQERFHHAYFPYYLIPNMAYEEKDLQLEHTGESTYTYIWFCG